MTDEIVRISDRGVGYRSDGTRTFMPAHTASTRHGAYAAVAISKRSGATAEALRSLAVVLDEADEPALQMFAFTIEQMKAAAAALEEADDRESRLRLSKDARGWAATALRFAETFGMTPRARAGLGLDLIRGQAAQLTVSRLAALADAETETNGEAA